MNNSLTQTHDVNDAGKSPLRSAALIGGISLLLMAIVAPLSEFGVFQRLILPNDAQTTLTNLIAQADLFRMGIAGFVVVALLDVIVAWALYEVFKASNKSLSALTGGLRVIYAAMLVVAIVGLPMALSTALASPQNADTTTTALQVSQWLRFFRVVWDSALIVFGGHLLVLGVLVGRSGYAPRWLGLLLLIAGLGYTLDSLGKLFVNNYTLNLSSVTFIGEVVLIFWLLWRAIKGFARVEASQN